MMENMIDNSTGLWFPADKEDFTPWQLEMVGIGTGGSTSHTSDIS